MARTRKAELVVLCEDVKHKTFVLRYLAATGFNPRQFRVRLPRAGRGSGEQWVRERYPTEVKIQRARANHTSASLIAVIDIESWVHFATHHEVDETADFKHRYQATDTCKIAADVAIEVCRSGAGEATAPPSLVIACDELRRVVPRSR